MSIRRGGTALQQDLFAPLPGHGRWARVLLADGNVGSAVARSGSCVEPGNCAALTASFSLSLTHPAPEWAGSTCGWKPNTVGEWFAWARVGVDDAAGLAHAAGLRLLEVTEVHGRYLTRTERA